ncbi:MAG: cellulase N-terminal Ig-like domain-containing protein, partial [Ferruginibacter sp.]
MENYQNRIKSGKEIKAHPFVQIKNLVKPVILFIIVGIIFSFKNPSGTNEWIRINQLGYPPQAIKVAVWVSKQNVSPASFQLMQASDSSVAFSATTGNDFGAYGPFTQSYRLNFSSFKTPGIYYLVCGG